jgi:hypothetical protein
MGISSALGSSALLPAGLGFRNKIINGDFRINQRGFTSTTTDGAFGFDRWAMGASGGTNTYSAQTFTAGNQIPGQEPINFARVVSSGQTLSGSYTQLSQKIEDVRTCAGQQVTISFYAKAASGTPKVSLELQQLFGTGGSPSSPVFTNAGQVTLSTSWVRYTNTVVVPSISGKTIGTANDHSLVLNFFLSAGSSLDARSGSLGLQSNTFDFWGIQLEQNYQPTPFEQRPIGVELSLCQRYYQIFSNERLVSTTALCGGVFFASSGSTAVGAIQHIVPLRVPADTANISFSNLVFDNQVTFGIAVTNVTVPSNRSNRFSTTVTLSLSSSATTNIGGFLCSASSSAAFISFNVEL